MSTTKLPSTAATPAVVVPVDQPVRPTAWMVRQGSRTYYVSDAEFVRSSYDTGSFTPLYGPEAQAAERERCAVTAWNHYMDTCRKTGRAPTMWHEWCASDSIRKA